MELNIFFDQTGPHLILNWECGAGSSFLSPEIRNPPIEAELVNAKQWLFEFKYCKGCKSCPVSLFVSFVFNKNVIISQHLNFSRRRASQLLNFHCHCRQAHQTGNKIILSKIFKMANNLFFYNFSYLCLCHCHCHCHFLCHCAGFYIIK